MREVMTTRLIKNIGELTTTIDPRRRDRRSLHDAAMWIDEDRVLGWGPTRRRGADERLTAQDCAVIPASSTPHTHLVFAVNAPRFEAR